jgi:hypothetical protein
MKRLIPLFVLVTIVLFALPTFAADDTLPNDPAVNPDANACLTGGLWEGKCGDSEYMWAGGWYLIRFHTGLIPREIFPDQYKWALPSLKSQLAGSGFPFPTCTATSTSGVTSTYEVVPFAASGTGYHAVASTDPGYTHIDFYMYYGGTKWIQSEGVAVLMDIVSTTCSLPSFP